MSASKGSQITKKTLDTQHTNKLNEFQIKAEKTSELKKLYNEIHESIQSYEEKRKTSPFSSQEQDAYISLIDERESLRKRIDSLENNDDEVDYLINTAPILFKYYDIIEKGKEDDMIQTSTNDKSILKWFVKNPAPVTDVKEDRAALLDKYMAYTDENYSKSHEQETTTCQNCGSPNMNVLLNDGIMYCDECSCVEYIIVDHDKPSYKESPREVSYFSYKRKLIDALKSHMPRLSEYLSWVNICDLRLTTSIRLMISSKLRWLVAC